MIDSQQIQCIASTKHCSWTFLHQWAITSIFGHFFIEHVQKLLFPELLVKILTLPLDWVTLTSQKRALTHLRSVSRHFSLIRHNRTVARASVLWRDINLLIDWFIYLFFWSDDFSADWKSDLSHLTTFSISHVVLDTETIFTKFELSQPNCSCLITFLLLIYYIMLWPWPWPLTPSQTVIITININVSQSAYFLTVSL